MMGQSADPKTTFGYRESSVSRTEKDILSDPGRSFTYDFGAFDASGEPVSVKTTARVHHVNASYSPADPGETIETVELLRRDGPDRPDPLRGP